MNRFRFVILLLISFINIGAFTNCFSMKKNGDPQNLLISAITEDKSLTVFDLLQQDEENVLGDDNFLKKSIVPLLSNKDPRIRGLASLFLFKKVYGSKITLPPSVFFDWKAAALNYKLKDINRVDSTSCAASIRVMCDHEFGDEGDYGVVLAVARPGTVSIPVQRKDLEEFYLVIAGQGEVWLKDIGSEKEQVITLEPGVTVKIPSTSIVQYRNTGNKNLIFLVPTNPPYNVVYERTNGKVEKVFENGKWPWKKNRFKKWTWEKIWTL